MLQCLQFHSSTQQVYIPLCQKNSGYNTDLNSVQAIIYVFEAIFSFIKNLRHALTIKSIILFEI